MLPHLDRIAYEIDLMCTDSEDAAAAWLALGATRLTFHVEATVDIGRLLASVRTRYGSFVSLGLALTIATDPAVIEQSLAGIDYVQFMGIARIGVQGQPFDPRVLDRVRAFHAKHPEAAIQVDGGVSLESAKKLVASGVTNVIVGSGILRASDPAAAFAALEALESSYGV
jgi:ribulose-phosphate 3-epimerase